MDRTKKVGEKLWYGFFIAVVIAISQGCTFYPQAQLPPIQNEILSTIRITPAQYVQCYTAPMIPAVCLSFLAGTLTDKFGPKPIVLFSLIVSTIGCVLRLYATSYGLFFFAMILTGLGPAFIYATAAKIMGNWVDKRKLSFAVGLSMVGGNVANFIATATTSYFRSLHNAFFFAILLSAFSVVFWWVFMKKENTYYPVDTGISASVGDEDQKKESLSDCLKAVLKNRTIWVLSLCMMFLQGYTISLSSSAPSALRSIGYSAEKAGLLASVLSVGSPLGCLVGAPLLSRTRHPHRILQVMLFVLACTMPFAWCSSSAFFSAVVLLYSGFTFGTCQVTIISTPTSLPGIGNRYAGTAGGLISTIQFLGAIFIPSKVIVPLANGNYHTLFYLAAASLLISLSVLFFISGNEKRAD